MDHASTITFTDARHDCAVRNYVTPFRLFTPRDETGLQQERLFTGTARTHVNMGGSREMPAAGWQAIDGLFSIDGIRAVHMRPFELSVRRFGAFDWNELHDNIIQTLAAAEPSFHLPPAAPVNNVRRIRWFDCYSGQVRHYGVTGRLFTPFHNLDVERGFPAGISGASYCAYSDQVRCVLQSLLDFSGIRSLTVLPFEVKVFNHPETPFHLLHAGILERLRPLFAGDGSVQIENRRHY